MGRSSLVKICHWFKAQWVAEVPDDLAICEFDCRKSQCSFDDWSRCTLRISNTPKEFVPLRRLADDLGKKQVA